MRSKRTSIRTHEVEQVSDPGAQYSEINARLRDIQQSLHQMSQELNSAQKSVDIELGRNRNIVVRAMPKPFVKVEKQNERAERYHAVNVLRTVAMRRVLCLER